MPKRQFHTPSAIILLTILLLLAMSLLGLEGKIGVVNMKRVDLFSDIRKGGEKPGNEAPSVDAQTEDSKKKTGAKVSASPAVDAPNNRRQHEVGQGPLDRFFQALMEAEENGRPVRVAYFGDSIIEGDRITGDLRRIMQTRFGGRGVGFVPITSIAPRSRNTIDHNFSGNWLVSSLHPKAAEAADLGISGFAYLPKKDRSVTSAANEKKKSYTHAWVEYEASRLFENTKEFSSIRLLYGTVKGFAFIKVKVDNKHDRIVHLEQGDSVRAIELSNGEPAKKVRVQYYANDTAIMYGVSFDESHGVFVDNYSIRGYSGVTLNSIPCTTFSAFNKYLKYKLIILHYGLNVASGADQKQLNRYRDRMIVVVNHLKSCMPDASILIVSVSDMAVRRGSDIATSKNIPALVEAQRQIAEITGAGFFDLFQSMGGENSMVAWVHDKKPLASPDYTHFNHRGAKKVAEMLSASLMRDYEEYRTKRTLPEGSGTRRSFADGV